MEIQTEQISIRNSTCISKRTLKNGTEKIYTYTQTYQPATNRVMCNKNRLHERITNCKDKELLAALSDLMDDLGL